MRHLQPTLLCPIHVERFWEHVAPGEPDECWPWTGAINTHGYGTLRVGRTNIGAHRASWMVHRGAVPAGLQVLHHCDNRPCCNPAHLFSGTHADNMRDRNEKGRQASGDRSGARMHPERMPRGERNGARLHPESVPRGEHQWKAKLTDAIVLMIRQRVAAGERQADVARDVGVTKTNVSEIVRRNTWKHI